MTTSSLKRRIEAVISASPLRVGVSLVNLRTQDSLTVGSKLPFCTASTNKIAALLELYRQVDAKRVNPSETIQVTEKDYPTGGSAMLDGGLLPGRFTIRDLATRMIVDSDNTATNVIMRRVGRENIRTTLQRLKLGKSMVTPLAYTGKDSGQRWVKDHWEYTAQSWAGASKCTPSELIRLLTVLWSGKELKAASKQTVFGIMLQTRDKSRIRGGLPALTPLAHKAGSHTGRTTSMPATWSGWREGPGASNDAGILMVSGHEYAIALMCEGHTATGSEVIRKISALTFDGLVGGTAAPPITAAYLASGTSRAFGT